MIKELISLALTQSKNAYSPYSKIQIGCACKTKSGKIFVGSNIENASYPLSTCAERVAITNAVANGEKEIDTIVIANEKFYPYPCGACRQIMNEFNKDMKVIVAKSTTDYQTFKLSELLPYSFEIKNK